MQVPLLAENHNKHNNNIHRSMNHPVTSLSSFYYLTDVEARKHQVFVANSTSGWTNNDIGLAWLEQLFEHYTKQKARRQWRLLLVDGHGSHLTRKFVEFCDANKILLAVFPPHSTHTL
jgi:hypothetical protein